MFLEIDQNSTQLPKRKRHCLSNRNQSNNSNSTSPNPETNKTIDGVNPQNKCKKIVKSKNKIKSKNKNKTETNKQTKTKKNSNNKTKNTKIKNKITDIEKIRSSAFTFDKETNRRARLIQEFFFKNK